MNPFRHFRWLALALALSSGAAAAAPPLVDGDWLAARLADPGLVLVDMSEDDAQYQRFHLPGAVRLAYGQLLKRRVPDNIPVRLADAELFALLGQLGIQRDRHVVVYDDVGGLEAARLFWELERIGHPQVSVLDGGLVRWILEGRQVENAPVTRAPARYRADAARRANEVTLAEVRHAGAARDGVLLDVRTEQEYRGDGKARSGHVPGARFWPWEQALDMNRGFVRAAGGDIEASLKQAGAAAKDVPIIAYCRSGHRAAHSYWVLRSLGFENVKLYANSMNEYLAEPGASLTRGKEP
jgi:thiosulfate/3-mercaptopyruvate sulfurtransferase